jgi:hypothetical protein
MMVEWVATHGVQVLLLRERERERERERGLKESMGKLGINQCIH